MDLVVQLGFNVQGEPTGFEAKGFPIDGLSSATRDFYNPTVDQSNNAGKYSPY